MCRTNGLVVVEILWHVEAELVCFLLLVIDFSVYVLIQFKPREFC